MATPAKVLLTGEHGTRQHPLAGLDTPAFVISELGPCRIAFSGQPRQRLWVETGSDEGGLWLHHGESIHLAEPRVPGNFKLALEEGKTQLDGFFSVLPHNLDSTQLAQMYDCIENRVQGLTRDWNATHWRRAQASDNNELLTFHKYRNELLYALNFLERNPLSQLAIHRVKGERGRKLELDTRENRHLKLLLSQLARRLGRLQEGHRLQRRQLEALAVKNSGELMDLRLAKSRILDPRNQTAQVYDLNKKIKLRQGEEAEFKRQLGALKIRHAPLAELAAKLHLLMNEGWLKGLEPAYSGQSGRIFSRHRGYREINRFIQLLERGDETLLVPPRHQTSKLFEYYGVLLCRAFLESHGFQAQSLGWGIGDPDMSTLEAEERIEFYCEASGSRVILSYDRLINDLDTAKKQGLPQLVSLIGGSRRPDILLERFDREGGFQDAVIFEVKYRRLRNIYLEEGETDVIRQLNHYGTFKYFQPGRPLNRHADISEIAVLYPAGPGHRTFQEPTLNHYFLSLVPTHFQLQDPQFDTIARIFDAFLDPM